MSSSQTCESSLSNTPTRENSTYFTKNTPKIVTAVSETFLPMESSESTFFLPSNSSRIYPARQDISSLSYGSFEKHFLWNTSLLCSQARTLNQILPSHSKLDNIYNRKKIDNISADNDKNITMNANNESVFVNQLSYNTEISETHEITVNDNLNSNCSQLKRNPYSIEEILKKPEKQVCRNEPVYCNHQKNEHNDNLNTQTNDSPTNGSNVINKRSRIRLKLYDISV